MILMKLVVHFLNRGENMAEEKKVDKNEETGFIHTEELRDLLKEKENEKKLPWYKKIFKKGKNKK